MEENNKLVMETIQDNVTLSEEEKLRRVKEAKGGTWYEDWKPYCMTCSYNGHMIGFNLTRLQESPLNK